MSSPYISNWPHWSQGCPGQTQSQCCDISLGEWIYGRLVPNVLLWEITDLTTSWALPSTRWHAPIQQPTLLHQSETGITMCQLALAPVIHQSPADMMSASACLTSLTVSIVSTWPSTPLRSWQQNVHNGKSCRTKPWRHYQAASFGRVRPGKYWEA